MRFGKRSRGKAATPELSAAYAQDCAFFRRTRRLISLLDDSIKNFSEQNDEPGDNGQHNDAHCTDHPPDR